MSENEQETQITTAVDTLFEEDIENLARPLCEKIQSLPKERLHDFQAKKALSHHERAVRSRLLMQVHDHIAKPARDDLLLVEVMDDSLQSYKAGSGYLNFWKYFCSVYGKRIAPYKSQEPEEIGLRNPNYELKGQRVKEYLRALAQKSNLTEDVMESLKLSEKGRYYAKPKNAQAVLESLGYGEDTIQAKDVDELLSTTYTENYEEPTSQDEDTKKPKFWKKVRHSNLLPRNPDLDLVSEVLQRAFEKAKETTKVNTEYLKGLVTLYVLSTQDELPDDIIPYIVMPFYEAQRKKRYSAEDTIAAINRDQRHAMASYFNLQPETWRKKSNELRNFLMEVYISA